MIPLVHPCRAEGAERYIARLRFNENDITDVHDLVLVSQSDNVAVFAGEHGLIEISNLGEDALDGDVIAVDPFRNSAERLVRANSKHNTFLITERCDQLCVMCSQPPKKTHIDRFCEFTQAALLAPAGQVKPGADAPSLLSESAVAMDARSLRKCLDGSDL